MTKGIAQRWKVLSGQNNWKNLLHPLDSDLRQYLLHYGAMAQATYDNFNTLRVSRYAGSSRYSRKNLFSRVGLVKGNPFRYEAVKYIYATSGIGVPESFIFKSVSHAPWSKSSNWMGYVAVATDEGKTALGRRDILVAWRGTVQPSEWLSDFNSPLVPASRIVGKAGGHPFAHQGILSVYTSKNERSQFNKTSARDQVISEVKRQVELHKHEETSITITGHSLGAALATLSAADIVANGYNKPRNQPNKPCPVTVFNFGGVKVGDSNFQDVLQSMNHLHILNINNARDIVPLLPPVGYSHVGATLTIDSGKSPYLKPIGDAYLWHSLEVAYLHTLAVEGGTKPKRDIALVNKDSDALKDKYLIPVRWWREKNHGMVQNKDGHWILDDHEKE